MTLFSHFKIDDDLVDDLKKRGIDIPSYSILDDENAIQIDERSYVNDNLIPVIEYKITVNKEALHQHQTEWKPLFALHYLKTLSGPPKWDSILLQRYLLDGIVEKFKNHILAPIIELQRKALDEDQIPK